MRLWNAPDAALNRPRAASTSPANLDAAAREELRQLVEQVRGASPFDRIDFRDPIARFGDLAIQAMLDLVDEPKLRHFAILVIGRAGQLGESDSALTALDRVHWRFPEFHEEVTTEQMRLLPQSDPVEEQYPAEDSESNLPDRLREVGDMRALGYSVELNRDARWNLLATVIFPAFGAWRVRHELEGFVALRRRMKDKERWAWAIGEWEYDLARLAGMRCELPESGKGAPQDGQ